MGLHFGRTQSPCSFVTVHDGYWYKGVDDDDYSHVRYPEPRSRSRRVRLMFGVSAWGVFIGVMIFGKPQD